MFKRGDIYYADLGNSFGSEQSGTRPCLIIQNNVGNQFSGTVIIAAITSRMSKTKIPTHVSLRESEGGLVKNSMVLLEQIRTIDKNRLREHMGRLSEKTMESINRALQISFGLA